MSEHTMLASMAAYLRTLALERNYATEQKIDEIHSDTKKILLILEEKQ